MIVPTQHYNLQVVNPALTLEWHPKKTREKIQDMSPRVQVKKFGGYVNMDMNGKQE